MHTEPEYYSSDLSSQSLTKTNDARTGRGVRNQTDRLQEKLDVLEKVTAELYERLSPVLRQLPPEVADGGMKEAAAPVQCDIADALSNCGSRLEGTVERLAKLISMVDV